MEPLKSLVYYPMLISSDGAPKRLSKEEDVVMWKKYLSLTRQKRDIITSVELPYKLKELQDKYNLSEVVVGKISVCVRMVFFQEMDMQTLATQVETILAQAGGDNSKASEIVSFIDKEIFHLVPKIVADDQEPTTAVSSALKKLPLLKALADYPRVGEQMVTSDKIKLRNQPEPQRPTLANWIRCYRDELGVGMHDQVTRGRFLFQSENGKKLSTQDRDRINLIIKSLEEEYPLDVDTDRMQIVFTASTAPAVQAPATAAAPKLTFPSAPQAAPERPVRPYTPPAQAAPAVSAPAPVSVGAGKGSFLGVSAGPAKNVAGDTLHFSTGHVLPGEKNANPAPTPAAPQPSTPAAAYPMTGINRTPGTPLRNPYSIRPLRLRNTALDREVDAR